MSKRWRRGGLGAGADTPTSGNLVEAEHFAAEGHELGARVAAVADELEQHRADECRSLGVVERNAARQALLRQRASLQAEGSFDREGGGVLVGSGGVVDGQSGALLGCPARGCRLVRWWAAFWGSSQCAGLARRRRARAGPPHCETPPSNPARPRAHPLPSIGSCGGLAAQSQFLLPPRLHTHPTDLVQQQVVCLAREQPHWEQKVGEVNCIFCSQQRTTNTSAFRTGSPPLSPPSRLVGTRRRGEEVVWRGNRVEGRGEERPGGAEHAARQCAQFRFSAIQASRS